MTKEEMLSIIYNEMADKTLSDGCMFIEEGSHYIDCISNILDIVNDGVLSRYHIGTECTYDIAIRKIIGHPVRIGDVLEYARLHCDSKSRINGVHIDDMYLSIIYLFDKRLSIDEQSESAIDFVYSLIK